MFVPLLCFTFGLLLNDSESHGRLVSFDLHNNRRLLLSRSFRVSFWKNLFQCRFYTFSRFCPFRVVLGWAYRGLTGGFLLLQNFCVAISVSPHVCFILVLILISMFLR